MAEGELMGSIHPSNINNEQRELATAHGQHLVHCQGGREGVEGEGTLSLLGRSQTRLNLSI